MFVQLTNAGKAALDAAQGPVTVTKFVLGSGYAYTPEPTQTALQGSPLFTGVPTSATPVTSSVWRYGCLLDSSVGPIAWGEIGLFLADGTLFAVAVSDTLIQKNVGDSARADVFVSLVGTNYAMWLDLAESNNPFKIAVLGSVDQLPASADASPNAYIVTGFQDDQQAFMAYTNRSGWWNFDAYDYASASGTETVIQDVGASSVSIANADFQTYMNPQTPGSVITEVVSGPAYSASRYVTGVVVGPSMTTLNFNTPWAIAPNVGDTIVFFAQRIDTLSLPIATHAGTGVVQIGNSLTVTTTGIIDVDYTQIPYPVTSFNGQTGAVTYQVKDQNVATGITLITDSGLTDGTGQFRRIVAGSNIVVTTDASNNLVISGSTNPYTLPVATTTTLGGVIVGTGLAITAGGVLSSLITQTTVNGQSGNVTIEVVNNNPATGLTLIADSGATTGIAKLYTLVAGTNTTITKDVNNNLVINNSYTLPVAGVTAAGTLGGVRVDGSTVVIDGNGVISAHVDTSTLAHATDTTAGVIILGPTLSVDSNGKVNYVLPPATTTSLGGIIVGSGLSVQPDGTLSVTAVGGVTSVSGQTGVVVVQATNTSTASGVTLITNSGATTGNIVLRQIVAGANTTVTTDANNNLVIAATASPYTLPPATTSTLGGIIVGTGLAVTAGGTLSVSGVVTSVSGQTGVVVVQATDTSAASGTTLITNSGSTTGNIVLRRLVAGTNVTLATDGNNNLVINNTSTAYTLPAATTTTLGGVIVGTGLSVTAGGTLSINTSGVVTSVSGQTGAVVVGAVPQNSSSGTSLIYDSGTTTGTIRLLNLVASATVTITPDSNNNLVLAAPQQPQYYDIQAGIAGAPTANQLIGQSSIVRSVSFSANFAGSSAYAGTAATATATVIVSKIVSGTTTQIGTVVFSAGATTGTFTTTGGASQSLSAGNVIQFTAPATADSTLANISITLAGSAA